MEDNERTFVFGDGKSGHFALYSAKGINTRVFSSGSAEQVNTQRLQQVLGDLDRYYKNKITR